MELQFQKSVIPCMTAVLQNVQPQEQTQEVRLTEGMPDIGRVLGCWGQVVIRGKEWNAGSAGVSGGVMVWVLYAPDDGSEPQSVETWLPFQSRWDFKDVQHEGTISVIPFIRSVDARSLSARKLMVRANICMYGKVMMPSEAQLYSPSALPDDMQVLEKQYPVEVPVESGEKAFTMEETLSLPQMPSPMAKLLRYTLHPELVDEKILNDKLVMRGVAKLNILYLGTDGQVHSATFDLPFSQYAELDREYAENATSDIMFAVTGLELTQMEDHLKLTAGITGQYVIYDHMVVSVVEDAYSTKRKAEPVMEVMKLPSVLERCVAPISANHSVNSDIRDVVDVVFYPAYPRMYKGESGAAVELGGVFQVIGYDSDGALMSAVSRWDGDWDLEASHNVDLDVLLQCAGQPQSSVKSDGLDLHMDLRLCATVTQGDGIQIVSGIETGEACEPDESRPSLILRRIGTERLWDIAKSTGSTVEMIMEANDLQQEPLDDRMLLIPVI